MINKLEVIDIMMRPQPVPEEFQEAMKNFYMHYTSGELVLLFKKTTNLTLLPAGGDLFIIKY
jgi:hypothetical protein